jgi:threonine aldolase
MIIFGLSHPSLTIPAFLAKLEERRILALATSGGIRFVTHKDIDDDDIDRAYSAFQDILTR